MKLQKSRTLKPILPLLIALSLTACGSPESTDDNNASSSDTSAPAKATVNSTPTTTNKDSEILEITGEIGATVWVNGVKKGKIGTNGKLLLTLDTSGSTGTKQFSIVIMDSSNNESAPLIITIERSPAQLPDTTAPLKAQLTTAPPVNTTNNSQTIEIMGEVEATVWVNGIQKGAITTNGKLILTLDTSGEDGIKQSSIVLKDASNNASEALVVSIEKIPAPHVEIAHAYGKATQGTGSSYGYYSPADLALDHDDSTFNHTSANAGENWWQVALPSPTLISKIRIKGRSSNTHRLNGSKVYIMDTPYNGTFNEDDLVATLAGTADWQITNFTTAKSGSYLIIQEDDNNLHLASVEVYGTMPLAPALNIDETEYLIPGASATGTQVATFNGVDYQQNTLTYQITNDVPFAIDSQGNITVNGELTEPSYTINVQLSDGENTTLSSITINTTASSAIEDVLASGDVIHTPITEEELIQATLDELEASKNLLFDAKVKIFNLDSDGTAKVDGSSLTQVNWQPTWDACTFISAPGENTMLLESNAVEAAGYTIHNKEMAVIGQTGDNDAGRYMVLASNPMRTTINTDMQQLLENSMAWLTRKDDLKTTPFSVVIAHVDNSYYFRDETKTREWLDTHYSGQVSYNAENTCDGTALAGCLNASPDLLIISQIAANTDDVDRIANIVKDALNNGVAVLYVHHDGNLKPLGSALFSSVFHITYEWDNRWARLMMEGYSPVGKLNTLSSKYESVKTLFTHLKNQDYNFDWSVCTNSDGEHSENNDRCGDVAGLSNEFQDGADTVRTLLNNLDNTKRNIFLDNHYRFYKLLALSADKFRQSVAYPMDKARTDNNDFMKSYYSDHAIYTYRKINPAQTDMGNFSRSDFSHITPITKTVSLNSKKSFRSTGAYALPGQTVTVTRNDSSDLTVKVFINTLRSGATHQYQRNGYNRPKYLKSVYFEIKSGESIELTSPYGGPLQLSFSKNDLPVNITFKNVGEHAYWASTADNESFTQKLDANEFDWAEVATAGFEVHSKLDKMRQSVADEKWGGTAEGLANAVVKYTSNYPHVLAGFKGNGVDVVPEIHDWANQKGITIETIDIMKHMNADQATCGYGCSGNPYDAYWAFDPIGHGDIHEMGHSMQKKRFEGFPNHAATNTFSYYTKSRYFDQTSGEPSCQGLPFKSLYETVQSSVGQADVKAYLKTNLWDKAGLGEQYLLKIQAMMHAQKLGKLENGWHVLARVHILEREKKRALQDWDNRKTSIGFSTYTRDEFNSIRDNDWLVVSYSYAAGLDYRNYFDMMGIPYSQKARDQIASFSFEVVPNSLFVSTNQGYCKQDAYGRIFDRSSLPVDGTTAYAY